MQPHGFKEPPDLPTSQHYGSMQLSVEVATLCRPCKRGSYKSDWPLRYELGGAKRNDKSQPNEDTPIGRSAKSAADMFNLEVTAGWRLGHSQSEQ